MATMKKEIAGQIVDIQVSEKDGTFSWRTANGEHSYNETSLPALVARIQKHLAKKRVSVNVPVGILEDNRRPVNVRLRRFSEKDFSEVLVKAFDGGPHDPIRKYADAYQLWDDASAAEFDQLRVAVQQAERALDAFKRARLLNPKVEKSGVVRARDVGDLLDKALDDKEALLAQKEAEKAELIRLSGESDHGTRVDEKADRAKELDSERDDYGPNPGDVGDL